MKTTLSYIKNKSGKTIIDFDNSVRLIREFESSYEAVLVKSNFREAVLKFTDEELMILLFKNYLLMVKEISSTGRIVEEFNYLDKIIFYYVKSLMSDEDIQEFAVFEGILDDIDQFLFCFDLNKNRSLLELLSFMLHDMHLINESQKNIKNGLGNK